VAEGPTELYAEVNPDGLVKGHSGDGTADILWSFPDPAGKIQVLDNGMPWKNKVHQRQTCLDRVSGTHVLLVDADEIYTEDDLGKIRVAIEAHPEAPVFKIAHVHLWKPPSVQQASEWYQIEPTGRWRIIHSRLFRNVEGIHYDDFKKNPSAHAVPLDSQGHALAPTIGKYRQLAVETWAVVYHYGYARAIRTVFLKERYYNARDSKHYRARGQAHNDAGPIGTWFQWEPGDRGPIGARILPWTKGVPYDPFSDHHHNYIQ